MDEKRVLEIARKIQEYCAKLGVVWTEEVKKRKDNGRLDKIELRATLKVTRK